MLRLKSLVLFCNSFKKSRDFYTNILGFSLLSEENPMPDCTVGMLEKNGFILELIERTGAPQVTHQDFATNLCFRPDNIEQFLKKCTDSGCRIKSPLRNIPSGARVFELFDPDGYSISLFENQM